MDGDLPSKAGAAELRELGYMMTQDTATQFGSDKHYNFLTPAGQEFAINYLVDSRFGKKADFRIRVAQVFINNAFLKDALQFTMASDKRLMEPLTDVAGGKVEALNDTQAVGFNVAITNAPTKLHLSDVMRDAVIAAVRDSCELTTQEQIQQAVIDALANVLKPGSVLHATMRGRSHWPFRRPNVRCLAKVDVNDIYYHLSGPFRRSDRLRGGRLAEFRYL